MEKIKKIPVIGYIFRLIYAFVKLPAHIDQMYEQNQKNAKEQGKLQNECIKLQNSIFTLQHEKEELQNRMQEAYKSIQQLQIQNVEQQRVLDAEQHSLIWASREIERLENLEMEGEYFEKLRLLLSIHPVLWGERERLHVSDLAAVTTCFFNTNSGTISVGDYTFAGSGVSILAGSHDQHLTGLLRRDAEIKEGCDIQIGKGVWLASNSTILGPATIGNNAVVAAGAVVVPRTIIPENTIYAGIPAKCIGKLELDNAEEIANPAINKALERNDGVLYVEGWSEQRERRVDGGLYRGHEQIESTAVIYTNKEQYHTHYIIEKETKVYCKIDDQEEQVYDLKSLHGDLTIEVISEKNEKQKVHVIHLRKEQNCQDLFFCKEKRDE